MNFPSLENCTVAVIGLGYVGLPLAVELSKSKPSLRTSLLLHRRVIGFDINVDRLRELGSGYDRTNETTTEDLESAQLLEFTANPDDLEQADVFVVTVPTPIDNSKRPDLSPLKKASVVVGQALRARFLRNTKTIPLVIFESTVYPKATEEVCIPVLEKYSGLRLNTDFCCGYSPERINPGDKVHRLVDIIKVTSGSNDASARWIDDFYGSIISAGTYKAESIAVAEAAKVIENTQRDLNIALVNELSIIFSKLGIDTLDVLQAAGTKWNFLPFRPGLVGGHCISVDPYYLTYKAEQLGYYPQVVLAGRRINDGMGRWAVEQLVLSMAQKGMVINQSNILILGLSFKENCPDLRNTRVVDLLNAVRCYGMKPIIVDPLVDPEEAAQEYNLQVLSHIPTVHTYHVVVLAVAHDEFRSISLDYWRKLIAPNGIFLDLKGLLPRELEALRL